LTDSATEFINVEHRCNILQDAVLPSLLLSAACSRSFQQWRAVELWLHDIFNGFYVFIGKTACSI